jgi:hypothetical protein
MMAGRPASIAEAFILNAERTPHKLCPQFEDEEWTYERLHERVIVRDDPGLRRSRTSAGRTSRATRSRARWCSWTLCRANALGKVLKYRVREGLIEPEE